MKIVDAKGMQCPKPLILTKKALDELSENDTLKVIVDNEISKINICRFLEDQGMQVKCKSIGNIHEILVIKSGLVFEDGVSEESCATDVLKENNYIIAFQKDKLGEGPEYLGKLLIKGFINTLPESTVLPYCMIFINSGIYLALKDSSVIDSLKKLETKGVEIIACGTCLDYFNKIDELGVGKVSNMYEIIEILSNSAKVIYP
ncbi:MAG: sulfurtransferase-like selenium metabolism protein YedF [Bacteroidia bacterium]|nr:sulfurtransferase-like selenium metabolism protein YedF [Bacteroidia bacterium]